MKPKDRIQKISKINKLILLSVVIAFVSVLVSYGVGPSINEGLFEQLLTINGILFGGVLASLAIIFGLLSSSELKRIYQETKNQKSRDIYNEFSNNLKGNTIVIFIDFIVILFLVIIRNISSIIDIIPEWCLFSLGLYLLFLSLSQTYDIIMSLFNLHQLRYEIAKKTSD